MFPYHDENETQRPAYVTMVLVAINVLVWILIQGAGSSVPLATSVCNLGLIPGELTGALQPGAGFPMGDGLVCLTDPGRQPFNVLTSMFLHGSWMHLLGNMWFLWLFGNNVEDAMSRPRFVVFYLLSGLAAALLQVVAEPGSAIPMVGASGAISGVMGAYLVLFPRVRVFTLVAARVHLHDRRAAGVGDAHLLGRAAALWRLREDRRRAGRRRRILGAHRRVHRRRGPRQGLRTAGPPARPPLKSLGAAPSGLAVRAGGFFEGTRQRRKFTTKTRRRTKTHGE